MLTASLNKEEEEEESLFLLLFLGCWRTQMPSRLKVQRSLLKHVASSNCSPNLVHKRGGKEIFTQSLQMRVQSVHTEMLVEKSAKFLPCTRKREVKIGEMKVKRKLKLSWHSTIKRSCEKLEGESFCTTTETQNRRLKNQFKSFVISTIRSVFEENNHGVPREERA